MDSQQLGVTPWLNLYSRLNISQQGTCAIYMKMPILQEVLFLYGILKKISGNFYYFCYRYRQNMKLEECLDMKNVKYISLVAIAFLCVSCVADESYNESFPVVYAEDEPVTLFDANKKNKVVCYPDAYMTARECADAFEQMGYMRAENIPSQPAQYDILQKNTYPTRRWREGEVNPRW